MKTLEDVIANCPKPYYSSSNGCIYQGDCLGVLPKMPPQSIDMILSDLPYHETGNKWDSLIDLRLLWEQYERIITETGAIVLTGTFRFGALLLQQAKHLYKYDWIWEKDNGTNAPNVNLQPFRTHEQVFVFGKGRVTNGTRPPMTYNPQKTQGKPYSQKSGRVSENWKGGLKNIVTDNPTGERHPKTIQKFTRDKDGLHPTQKPVALFEYLIRTYTNGGGIVLDNCLGSGTTAVACTNLGRRYIGIELNEKYCEIAVKRIQAVVSKVTGTAIEPQPAPVIVAAAAPIPMAVPVETSTKTEPPKPRTQIQMFPVSAYKGEIKKMTDNDDNAKHAGIPPLLTPAHDGFIYD